LKEWEDRLLSLNPEIDVSRITDMGERILEVIKKNSDRGPRTRARVQEGLNALALISGTIIRLVPSDDGKLDALNFFMDALNQHLVGGLET
jgi:hypothetical protein